MTDREMLEYAAKAAGVKRLNSKGPLMEMKGHTMQLWNPLEDEYAATRLAIVRAAAEIGRTMP